MAQCGGLQAIFGQWAFRAQKSRWASRGIPKPGLGAPTLRRHLGCGASRNPRPASKKGMEGMRVFGALQSVRMQRRGLQLQGPRNLHWSCRFAERAKIESGARSVGFQCTCARTLKLVSGLTGASAPQPAAQLCRSEQYPMYSYPAVSLE